MIESGNGMTLVTDYDMLAMNPSCPGRSAKRVFAPDVPGIHVFLSFQRQDVDGWNKSGHDERER